MKKIFMPLVLIVSQQSALAATLKCTLNNDEKKSVTIIEDAPQVGLATLTWSSGDSSVATSLEKNSTWGCMEFTEKTYFHSQYTLNISAKKGLKQTRCAGMGSLYTGYISDETHTQHRLTCKVVHF